MVRRSLSNSNSVALGAHAHQVAARARERYRMLIAGGEIPVNQAALHIEDSNRLRHGAHDRKFVTRDREIYASQHDSLNALRRFRRARRFRHFAGARQLFTARRDGGRFARAGLRFDIAVARYGNRSTLGHICRSTRRGDGEFVCTRRSSRCHRARNVVVKALERTRHTLRKARYRCTGSTVNRVVEFHDGGALGHFLICAARAVLGEASLARDRRLRRAGLGRRTRCKKKPVSPASYPEPGALGQRKPGWNRGARKPWPACSRR